MRERSEPKGSVLVKAARTQSSGNATHRHSFYERTITS